jgi:hypothetical protein
MITKAAKDEQPGMVTVQSNRRRVTKIRLPDEDRFGRMVGSREQWETGEGMGKMKWEIRKGFRVCTNTFFPFPPLFLISIADLPAHRPDPHRDTPLTAGTVPFA